MIETPEIERLGNELLGCVDRYQNSTRTASEISAQLAELSKTQRIALESPTGWTAEEGLIESRASEIRRKLFVMASAMESVAENAQRYAEVMRLYANTLYKT